MLVNRLTGEKREVDAVLRSTTARHETVIAIEAAGRARRAAVEAGFSRQARTLKAPADPDHLLHPVCRFQRRACSQSKRG